MQDTLENKGEISFRIWNSLSFKEVREVADTLALHKYTDKGKEIAHLKLIWFNRIIDREMFDAFLSVYGEK